MDEKTTRLLEAIKGIDLTSADGRAGIGSLLAEIERVSPGAILQRAASIELRRLGLLFPAPEWDGLVVQPMTAEIAKELVIQAPAHPAKPFVPCVSNLCDPKGPPFMLERIS